jgi:hypothetical protein
MQFATNRGTRVLCGLSVACLVAGVAVAGCGGSSKKHLSAANATSPTSAAGLQCEWGKFSATVRHGPDKGLSVSGRMRLMVAQSGSINGAVVALGRALLFTGAAQGNTMQIALSARNGLQMKGVGIATAPIHGCADVPASGSLTGPRTTDTGDWALAERSPEAKPYEAERAAAPKSERAEKVPAEKFAE